MKAVSAYSLMTDSQHNWSPTGLFLPHKQLHSWTNYVSVFCLFVCSYCRSFFCFT